MIQSYVPKPKSNQTNQKKVGIYVSKPNKDVHSENRDDFVFIPDRPSVSIMKRISLQTVQPITDPVIPFVINDPITAIAEYKHGLGYIPEIIVFVTTGTTEQAVTPGFDPANTYINVPSEWLTGDAFNNDRHVESFDAYADSENIYVTAQRYAFTPGIISINIAATYNFDILLLMEEAK